MERYAGKMRDLRINLDEWEAKQKELPPDQRKPPPGVYIGTVHATKGAQWKNCYVQMAKGKFPFEPKPKPGEPEPVPDPSELETERRLAYVAITRASQNLTIVCPGAVGGKPAGVSPFVAEAGLMVGENIPKGEGTEEVKTASDQPLHAQLGLDSFPSAHEAELEPEYNELDWKADPNG